MRWSAKDDTRAVQAIRAVENYIPDSSDLRRRLYNSLMADAIAFGCLPAIDYLLGKSQTGYASGMAQAAQIDQIESFSHFVAKAKKENVELPVIDLETTLLMSTERGAHRVTQGAAGHGRQRAYSRRPPPAKCPETLSWRRFRADRDIASPRRNGKGRPRPCQQNPTRPKKNCSKKFSAFALHLKAEAAKNYSFRQRAA